MTQRTGYRSLTSFELWPTLKHHNSSTFHYIALVTDFIQQVASAHNEFSKRLKGLVKACHEKMDFYLPVKNSKADDKAWCRVLWSDLTENAIKTAQFNYELCVQLKTQVANKLEKIIQYKELQSKLVFEFREQVEEMLNGSVKDLHAQQSIYNNAIQDYARMTSISTTKKPLENQKDSSLFSSISSSLSSFSYNCTKHNECVLMVRSCEAIEAQYGRTVVPALMEGLEDIYLDTVNQLMLSLQTFVSLLHSKAQKETKIHEECLNTISKERSSPREQLIELVNDLNDKEKTQNKCTEIYKMDFTSPNTESCFTGSDEKTKRTYNFCIPEPIASSCSTEKSQFNKQLTVDGYTLAELDAKKASLKKTALEVLSSFNNTETQINSLHSNCQKKFEENDYMGTYESQTELYGKRLSVHKDVMHLASIASQLELLAQKENFTTNVPVAILPPSGKLSIKTMWKQAFKNLRVANLRKKDNNAQRNQQAANQQLMSNQMAQREVQLLEKYSKLFLATGKSNRSDVASLENGRLIHEAINRAAKTARVKPIKPNGQSNNKKIKSFKTAAKLLLNHDKNDHFNAQNVIKDGETNGQKNMNNESKGMFNLTDNNSAITNENIPLSRRYHDNMGVTYEANENFFHAESQIDDLFENRGVLEEGINKADIDAYSQHAMTMQHTPQYEYASQGQSQQTFLYSFQPKFQQNNVFSQQSHFYQQPSEHQDWNIPLEQNLNNMNVLEKETFFYTKQQNELAGENFSVQIKPKSKHNFKEINTHLSRFRKEHQGEKNAKSKMNRVQKRASFASQKSFSCDYPSPSKGENLTLNASETFEKGYFLDESMFDKCSNESLVASIRSDICDGERIHYMPKHDETLPVESTSSKKAKAKNKKMLFYEQKSFSFDVAQEPQDIKTKRNSSDPTVFRMNRRISTNNERKSLRTFQNTRNVWISTDMDSRFGGYHCVQLPSLRLNKDVLEKIREDSLNSEKESSKETDTEKKQNTELVKKHYAVEKSNQDASNFSKKRSKPKITTQRSRSVDVSRIQIKESPIIRSAYGSRSSQRDYLNQQEIEEMLTNEIQTMHHDNFYYSSQNDCILHDEPVYEQSVHSSENLTISSAQKTNNSDVKKPKAAFRTVEKRRLGFTGQKSFSCDAPGSDNLQSDGNLAAELTVPIKVRNNSDTYIGNNSIITELDFPVPKHEIHTLIILDSEKVKRQLLDTQGNKRNKEHKFKTVSDGVVKWKRKDTLSPDDFNNVVFVETDNHTNNNLSPKNQTAKKNKQEENSKKPVTQENERKDAEMIRTSSLKKMMHFHSMKPVHNDDLQSPGEGTKDDDGEFLQAEGAIAQDTSSTSASFLTFPKNINKSTKVLSPHLQATSRKNDSIHNTETIYKNFSIKKGKNETEEFFSSEKKCTKRLCVALRSFQADKISTLSFRAGQMIHLMDKNDSIWWKGKIKNKIGYIPSNHVCTFERGEKLMTLIEAVEVFDEKMRVKSPIKLAKNQLVVQETCNSKGLAVIRSCTIHYKMLCPNKYLREIEPFY